ncbi:MAG: hypothetical protein WBN81_06935, partial [Gammaproteobacteria bacterium]
IDAGTDRIRDFRGYTNRACEALLQSLYYYLGMRISSTRCWVCAGDGDRNTAGTVQAKLTQMTA